jgi:hypothetical protein
MTTGPAGNATVALNAEAGAARWDAIPVPPPEVRERLYLLRDEVHTTLHSEFDTTAVDLDQLRGILADAAEKLSAAFCEMTGSLSQLVRLIDAAHDQPGGADLDEVRTIALDITSRTGSTVQSLQFEDMATQLLQHVGRRLATLEAFSKDMSILHPHPDDPAAPLTDAVLDDLFRRLDAHRTELLAVGRKTVQQQSLDSGGIELF